MITGRHIPAVLALLAGCSVAGCNLPDPDYKGKVHEEPGLGLTRPEILAGVLTRVAHNAEKSKDYETAELFYRRAYKLGSKKIETMLGLARTLTAMNEPLAASEAYGSALAINEHDEEAVAGLAKSLEMVAANSAKNKPMDMPPPPAMADATPENQSAGDKSAGIEGTAMPEPGMDGAADAGIATDAKAVPPAADQMTEDTGEKAPAAAAGDGATDDSAASAAPSESGLAPMATASGPTGDAPAMGADAGTGPISAAPSAASDGKVKLNDVLSAIEWNADKTTTAPGTIPPALEPEGVQTAGPAAATMSPAPTTDGAMPRSNPDKAATTEAAAAPAAEPMASPMASTTHYRLQFGAFGSAARAESARARLGAKAKGMLGNATLEVEKVDRGAGKAPVYKLRSGGVGDRSSAATLCARLKAQTIGCFLVKPMRTNAMRANPTHNAAITPPPRLNSATATMIGATPPPVASAAPAAPAAKQNPVIRWEVVEGLQNGAAKDGAGKSPAGASASPFTGGK